jgi:peptidoglycan/xylan/chitin deacetylase (PgdA/CDA1 family)
VLKGVTKLLGQAVLLSLLAVQLWGCTTAPTAPASISDLDVIAEDERHAIVRLRTGQSPEDLARLFLGSTDRVGEIREINPANGLRSGSYVAVPLTPVNVTGVFSDSYRTLPILCYHQFTHDRDTAHRLELNAEKFEDQLRYMKRNGYLFLSMADVSEMMRQRRPLPEKSVVITIDDGFSSVYDVAWPILQRNGVKATLFIYTDFIGAGAALNWDQLREMKESGLIEVESHGKTHASLSRTPDDTNMDSYKLRLAAELSGSEAAFMVEMGAAPRFFSYPYGNSSPVIASMLEDSGYELAATVTRGGNGSFMDPYLMHRSMIYQDHTLKDLQRFLRVTRQR